MFGVKSIFSQKAPILVDAGSYNYEGNFNDSLPQANHLTPLLGASTTTALSAQGSYSYLTSPTSLGAESSKPLFIPGDFTLRFFAYRTAHTNVSGTFFSTRTSSTELDKISFVLNNTGTRLQLVIGTGSEGSGTLTLIDAVVSFPLFTWHHVVLERTGTTTRIYLNGNSVGTTTAYTVPLTGKFNIGAIGYSISGNYRPWTGYLDDSDITPSSIYNGSNFTPPVYTGPIIIGRYVFDGNYNDNSAQANNLTAGSGVTVTDRLNSAAHSSLGAQSGGTISLPGAFTIEMRATATSFTSTLNALFAMRPTSSTASKLDFGVNNTGTRFLVQNGSTSLINAVYSFSTGAEYHFCIQRSGTTLNAYINGSIVGTATTSALFNDTFRIGSLKFTAASPANNRAWIGSIDNVRIANNATIYPIGGFTPDTDI